MSTLPNDLMNRPGPDAPASPVADAPLVSIHSVRDPHIAIEAAGVLGEQRAWLERLLGQAADPSRPESLAEYAHPETFYRPPNAALFVGRVGGFPAGVVAASRLDATTVELRRLYVRPNARRTGLGRRLSLAVIRYARQRAARFVRLDTSTTLMPDAVRMYRSLGFRDVPPLGYHDVPGIIGMELAL